MKKIASCIREKGFRGSMTEDEPLAGHCSLKVGGPADLFAVALDSEDLATLVACLREAGLPWILLGAGTNVLFTNGGFHGCVVTLGGAFQGIRREGEADIYAGGAAPLPSLVLRAGSEALSGLECLAGIPGSVGGAVRMNAGTREGNIADTLHEVRLLEGDRSCWIKKDQIDFGYRRTSIKDDSVVLGARFRLTPSSSTEVLSKVRAAIHARRERQPVGTSSAGCWFRNPKGDSAGRLIERAGMKGARCGGARVSTVHANFLENAGGASAADFLLLADRIRDSVEQRFGVRLEEEVRIIHG